MTKPSTYETTGGDEIRHILPPPGDAAIVLAHNLPPIVELDGKLFTYSTGYDSPAQSSVSLRRYLVPSLTHYLRGGTCLDILPRG